MTKRRNTAPGFDTLDPIFLLLIKSYFLNRVKVREGRFGEITEILAWYEYINDVILDHLDDEIKSTNKSGVWRYLISFKVEFIFNNMIIFRISASLYIHRSHIIICFYRIKTSNHTTFKLNHHQLFSLWFTCISSLFTI